MVLVSPILYGEEPKILTIEPWDNEVVKCPICKADAIVIGETELLPDAEDLSKDSLIFLAESFRCSQCGLALDDPEELRMLGIEDCYDKTQELDSWFEDHYTDYEPDISDYYREYEPDYEAYYGNLGDYL